MKLAKAIQKTRKKKFSQGISFISGFKLNFFGHLEKTINQALQMLGFILRNSKTTKKYRLNKKIIFILR